MRIIRLFFCKKDEAAYISHLDLQRVMARAIKRSKMPVWYSKGFNPHIYMSFSLPLPLMQHSIVESCDFKTESDEDMSLYLAPLNEALPQGLVAMAIKEAVHPAADIAFAQYDVIYGDEVEKEALEKAVADYNMRENVMVVRKTKRTQTEINLKEVLPHLSIVDREDTKNILPICLPAGGTHNYNPLLLIGFLSEEYDLPFPYILRTKVCLEDNTDFC